MDKSVQAPEALLRAQKLANLTDTKVRIPVLGIRLGLDFLVGLIPVVGDIIMVGVSLSIVAMAKQIGVPTELRSKMLANIAIDFLLGLIPFVGDVLDLFYKSNQKNVRIMEQCWVAENYQDIQQNTRAAIDEWDSKM